MTPMNLFTALTAAWPATLDEPAILTDTGHHYTWRDLDRATAMMANLLRGLRLKGHAGRPPVVAAHVDKSVEALMLYLATLRAGCAFLPLNPAYRQSELDYFVNDARPSVLVCRSMDQDWVVPLAAHGRVAHLFTLNDDRTGSLLVHAASQSDQHPIDSVEADDLAAILYTSGTTGRSKGALLSHGNLLSNARTLLRHWDWRTDDVLVHALPIFHIHGLFVAGHCALLSGTAMRWLNKFDASSVMEQIQDTTEPRATVFMGVPTMYGRLLDTAYLQPAACADMRLFISGSAPLLSATAETFAQRSGHQILERYGMSETGMLCSNPCRPREGLRVPGSVGRPLPGVGLRITNDHDQLCPTCTVGHVQVRGPNVFKGYLGMPEKTREAFTPDGWFRTGDVGRIDAQGYVHLSGRAKDLIITGGFNVYPAEVEGHLDKLPGVVESAVVGVPHPDFGEGVIAIVVPQADHAVDEQALIQTMKDTIAGFKVPKRVFFATDLPRNAMGKVQKNLLRQQHQETFA
ncbi:AMP-binding protein [Aquabacterium sp. CECT 9606]|uniref:AMP-binding protein n=1 Tax=Aquabacterium sp. CECT 9606 TaxID=2845822 RepID=UPI001E53F503|nr:AMP-binding protein [Aquabacterium sp. CECT 9606]CAH0348749.1 Long-chain-fatty-acid--CoA ligase [Aquabacterium sp. CECT 9606]